MSFITNKTYDRMTLGDICVISRNGIFIPTSMKDAQTDQIIFPISGGGILIPLGYDAPDLDKSFEQDLRELLVKHHIIPSVDHKIREI